MLSLKKTKHLITKNRIDIIIKIIYLELLTKSKVYAQKIYTEHIDSFTLGKFHEPGSNTKINLQKFIEDFAKIETSIKSEGFRPEVSAIPISVDGSILNGSHRTAASIKNNIEFVTVSSENKESVNYDYDFFLSREMSPIDLDYAIIRMIEIVDDVYTAIIWPTCSANEKILKEFFADWIFYREFDFNYEELHKFIIHTYMNQDWIGSLENKYVGAMEKSKNCFKKGGKVKIITFKEKNLKNLHEIKIRFRNKYNLEKNSIHTTDNKDETLNICNLILNVNGLHFLKNSNLADYKLLNLKLSKFKADLERQKLDIEDYAIDGGFVMELYGLRKAVDFDVIELENPAENKKGLYSSHNNQIAYYGKSKEELLFNPRNYFKYAHVKIVSLENIYDFKKNRLEKKDKKDIKMLEQIIYDKKIRSKSKLKKTIKFYILRQKIKAYTFVENLTNKIWPLEVILNIIRKIKS